MEVDADGAVEVFWGVVASDFVALILFDIPEVEGLFGFHIWVAVGDHPLVGFDVLVSTKEGVVAVAGELAFGEGGGCGVVLIWDDEVGVAHDFVHEESWFAHGVVDWFEGAPCEGHDFGFWGFGLGS